MTFISIALGSFIGTLFGNFSLFWIIGTMAKKQEEKQKEELGRLQAQFLEMRQKEIERMQKYARMES